MDLDSKGLGRLRRVADPRGVWAMEAGDFTPWLAENLDVLADELGLVLTTVATEVPVGSFYLDIVDGRESISSAMNCRRRRWTQRGIAVPAARAISGSHGSRSGSSRSL